MVSILQLAHKEVEQQVQEGLITSLELSQLLWSVAVVHIHVVPAPMCAFQTGHDQLWSNFFAIAPGMFSHLWPPKVPSEKKLCRFTGCHLDVNRPLGYKRCSAKQLPNINVVRLAPLSLIQLPAPPGFVHLSLFARCLDELLDRGVEPLPCSFLQSLRAGELTVLVLMTPSSSSASDITKCSGAIGAMVSMSSASFRMLRIVSGMPSANGDVAS